MKYNAIVVLGNGVRSDGQLTPINVSRVKKAASLYKKGLAPRLIVSGKHSFTKLIAPPVTEASAMKDLAVSLGVPESKIILEDQSLDTVGNAYFTKKILKQQHWHKIIIVSTQSHLPRVEYIFAKVLGPKFQFKTVGTTSHLPKARKRIRLATEDAFFMFTVSRLDKIKPGNSSAIWRFLKKIPGYDSTSKNKKGRFRRALRRVRQAFGGGTP